MVKQNIKNYALFDLLQLLIRSATLIAALHLISLSMNNGSNQNKRKSYASSYSASQQIQNPFPEYTASSNTVNPVVNTLDVNRTQLVPILPTGPRAPVQVPTYEPPVPMDLNPAKKPQAPIQSQVPFQPQVPLQPQVPFQPQIPIQPQASYQPQIPQVQANAPYYPQAPTALQAQNVAVDSQVQSRHELTGALINHLA